MKGFLKEKLMKNIFKIIGVSLPIIAALIAGLGVNISVLLFSIVIGFSCILLCAWVFLDENTENKN